MEEKKGSAALPSAKDHSSPKDHEGERDRGTAVSSDAPSPGKVILLPSAEKVKDARLSALSWALERWRSASLLAVCLVPTLITAVYVLFLATERYAVEAQFAVRSQESTLIDASGILGAIGGTPDPASTDAFMVTDFLQSVDFITQMQERLDLQAIYGADTIDRLSRLDTNDNVEDTADYWRSVSEVYFDNTKGTIVLEVTAFKPEEAMFVAGQTLSLASELVNRISEESRIEALRSAREDLARAELRLRGTRLALLEFREQEQIADPVLRAGAAQELIATLEGELARVDAEIASSSAFLSETAPTMIVLQSRKASLEGQIAQARAQIGGSSSAQGANVAQVLSDFEEVQIEQEFAQEAYTLALASLEAARAEANRNQRYLAIFVQPTLPQEAKYPQAHLVIPTVFAYSFILWLIGVLIFYGIREHTN